MHVAYQTVQHSVGCSAWFASTPTRPIDRPGEVKCIYHTGTDMTDQSLGQEQIGGSAWRFPASASVICAEVWYLDTVSVVWHLSQAVVQASGRTGARQGESKTRHFTARPRGAEMPLPRLWHFWKGPGATSWPAR